MGTSIRSWRASFVVFLAGVVAASTMTTIAVAGSVLPRGGGVGDPVSFLRRVVSEIVANDYASAWKTLDPAQQKLVPQAEYIRCESLSPIPGELTSVRLVARTEQSIAVPGTSSGPVPSTAVTFRLTITSPTLHDSVVVVHTVHAVRAGGRWAWILPAGRLDLHRSGTCTDAPTYAYHPNARPALTPARVSGIERKGTRAASLS